MLALKQAAIGGVGVVALPGYVCRDEVQSGLLQRIPTRLDRRRFDADGDNAVPAGFAAIGPRLRST